MLVEGAETAGPVSRHLPLADHGVLAADAAYQVDGALDERPPVVRVLALVEQFDAGLDAHLGTAGDQLGQLVPGQAVEQAERGEIVDQFGHDSVPHLPPSIIQHQ